MVSETVTYWISHYGYTALFTLLALGIVGLPVPDEILLVYAGFLIHKGDLAALPTIIVAFGGSSLGITVSFLLGRSGGWYLVNKYGHYLHLTPDRIENVHNWFKRIGKWFLLIGYYLIGIRHLTAFVAGTSRFEWRTFAIFAYSGAFLWSLSFITLGWFLGQQWQNFGFTLHKHLLTATIVLIILGCVYYFIEKKFFLRTRRGQKSIKTK